MLSADLNNIAAMLRNRLPSDQSSPVISRHTVFAIVNTIEDCALQARELEKQVAPGSPRTGSVVPLRVLEKAASA